MNANDIQELKNRCKYGCAGLYTPKTVLGIINYFEEQFLKMEQAQEKREQEHEEEKYLLLRQIERSIEDQSKEIPVIPLEVAEAIVFLRQQGYSNYTIITDLATYNWDKDVAHAFKALNSVKNRELLLKVLVIGYTIEQEPTPEDLLKKKIQETYEGLRITKAFKPDYMSESEFLSVLILDCVQKFYADKNT